MAGVLPLQQTIAVILFSPLLPISLKNFHKAYLIANPTDREKMIRIRLYLSAVMKGVLLVECNQYYNISQLPALFHFEYERDPAYLSWPHLTHWLHYKCDNNG